MAAFLALLLKFLPIILALFGVIPAVASYQVMGGVAGNVGVNSPTFQYVGGYSALAAAGWTGGEWLRSIFTKMLTGGLDISKLVKVVQLLMRLMVVAKSDPELLKLIEDVLGFKLSFVPDDEKSLVRLLMEK